MEELIMATKTNAKTVNEKEMKKLARKFTKIQAQIKALKDEEKKLKEEMVKILECENSDAMVVDEYTIRNTDIYATKFDSTRLKKNSPDIWKLYSKTTYSTRFTVTYTAPVTQA